MERNNGGVQQGQFMGILGTPNQPSNPQGPQAAPRAGDFWSQPPTPASGHPQGAVQQQPAQPVMQPTPPVQQPNRPDPREVELQRAREELERSRLASAAAEAQQALQAEQQQDQGFRDQLLSRVEQTLRDTESLDDDERNKRVRTTIGEVLGEAVKKIGEVRSSERDRGKQVAEVLSAPMWAMRVLQENQLPPHYLQYLQNYHPRQMGSVVPQLRERFQLEQMLAQAGITPPGQQPQMQQPQQAPGQIPQQGQFPQPVNPYQQPPQMYQQPQQQFPQQPVQQYPQPVPSGQAAYMYEGTNPYAQMQQGMMAQAGGGYVAPAQQQFEPGSLDELSWLLATGGEQHPEGY